MFGSGRRCTHDITMNRSRFSGLAHSLIKTELLLLVLANCIDLLGTRTCRIKHVAEPLLRQSPGQLQPDDTLAHTQHLGVVAEDGSLDTEAVVGGDSAHTADLVGADGHPEASPTDQQRSIAVARGNELGCCRRAVRVRRLVVFPFATNVRNGLDARVGREIGFDGFFVRNAGVLCCEESRWLFQVHCLLYSGPLNRSRSQWFTRGKWGNLRHSRLQSSISALAECRSSPLS